MSGAESGIGLNLGEVRWRVTPLRLRQVVEAIHLDLSQGRVMVKVSVLCPIPHCGGDIPMSPFCVGTLDKTTEETTLVPFISEALLLTHNIHLGDGWPAGSCTSCGVMVRLLMPVAKVIAASLTNIPKREPELQLQ